MNRLRDLRTFYEILANLQRRIGKLYCLRECHGRMKWPRDGVYCFFEHREERTTSGAGSRVVRVGTHAITATSSRTLWTGFHNIEVRLSPAAEIIVVRSPLARRRGGGAPRRSLPRNLGGREQSR